MSDRRREAPAVARNRDAILRVLRGVLPAQGPMVNAASGTGEHRARSAAALPALVFQPTEPEGRASVDAWCAGLRVVRPALDAGRGIR
jgi:hypothetical protein